MKKSYEIDMCNGPLLGKILLFSIPLGFFFLGSDRQD